MKHPEARQHYRHYKGGEYEVIGFAHHTETGEKIVLYKPLQACKDFEESYPEGIVFARPFDMFVEKINCTDIHTQRFSLIEKEEPPFVPREGQVDFTHVRWCPVINCVLVYKDKILLVERSKKMRLYPEHWSGISGFLDDNKSLEEKVYEELCVETGLTKEKINSITVCDVLTQEDIHLNKTWVVHAVRVEIVTDIITLDWEAQNYTWTTKEEALKFKLLPGFEDVLNVVI